ncbi:MAG: hypothetical protein JO091_03610 [Acidobacteriaceae bacterium]|nr:hypothetical protein [Acidobacteriaceae bacterium]
MPSMRAYLAHYAAANAGSGTLPWDSEIMKRVARQEHVPIEEFTPGQALTGPPEDLIAELENWRAKVNPDSIELMLTGPRDYYSVREMLELFGKKIMPHFN